MNDVRIFFYLLKHCFLPSIKIIWKFIHNLKISLGQNKSWNIDFHLFCSFFRHFLCASSRKWKFSSYTSSRHLYCLTLICTTAKIKGDLEKPPLEKAFSFQPTFPCRANFEKRTANRTVSVACKLLLQGDIWTTEDKHQQLSYLHGLFSWPLAITDPGKLTGAWVIRWLIKQWSTNTASGRQINWLRNFLFLLQLFFSSQVL